MLKLTSRAKQIILAIERMKYLCGKTSLTFAEVKERDNIILALNGLRGDLAGLPVWRKEGEISL